MIYFALNSNFTVWCKMEFIGREEELKELSQLSLKKTASLVTIQGRRRIGKSSLVEHFAKTKSHFYEFQGLAPREGLTKQHQLDHFADQFKTQVEDIPGLHFESWTQAFSFLNKRIKKESTVILFDEISWMAHSDPDFVGKLKTAWDTEFKKHPKLILVLCGSVSSWIEKNIIKETDFMGRISLSLQIKELPLQLLPNFWGKYKDSNSAYDMLQLIAVTGGIPRYLEEIKPNESASINIEHLCYKKSGVLFHDFDKIFNDIFEKKSTTYQKIVNALAQNKLNLNQIASKIKMKKSGTLSLYLADLVLAGFIEKSFIYNFKKGISKIIFYRISDNYLRFYLRHILPHKDDIIQSRLDFNRVRHLAQWEQTMGYQFESTILNNISLIYSLLGLKKENILWSGSFIQTKNSKNKGACQIDLLIHSNDQSLYLCEIKFRKNIGTEVVKEVKRKISVLKYPRYLNIRKVLIFEGELSEHVRELEFFDYLISGNDLFNTR